MPLPTGMSLQCGGAKALGKTGPRGGGGLLEGRWKGRWKACQRWKGLLEGCRKGAGRGSSARRFCWKVPLEGVPALERGFQQGSS